MQVSISIYISPEVGCWISWATITKDPITLYWSLASSGGMPTTDVWPLPTDSSLCRDYMISTNLVEGRGACSQALPVVASPPTEEWSACQSLWWQWVVSHLRLPTGTHLGRPGGCSCDCSLMGWVPLVWVSSPLSNWMVQQPQNPPLWMKLVAPWPVRVLPCFPQDGDICQEQAVGSSQPSIAAPSHRWPCAATAQVDNPEYQTAHLGVAGTGTSLLKGVMVGVCGHCQPPLPCCVPLALQRRHTPSWQAAGSLHNWGFPPVPPTNWASGPVWHTMLSTPCGTGERALGLWVLTLVWWQVISSWGRLLLT